MSAETEFGYKGKMRRRKRATDGQAFNDGLGEQLDALKPLKDSGLYCKNCGKWWKWKDFIIEYGQTAKKEFTRAWACKHCGQQVKEELI